MGLFGKIFDKKVCDICGGEIGLMGNRKLADGNCCKDCSSKLSPWFSERKSSTVQEIKEQLEYREENREKAAQFQITRTFGRGTKVLLDEDRGWFTVTSASRIADANPDILEFSQVTGCDLDVRENRQEVKRDVRDREGHLHSESYSPRRYKYSYDFYLTIYVNHPWFDQMRFQLNNRSISVDYNDGAMGMVAGPGPGFGGARPGGTSKIAGKVSQQISRNTNGQLGNSHPGGQPRQPGMNQRMQMPRQQMLEGSTMPPTLEICRSNPDYAELENMAAEIKEALMQVRQEARENAAAQAAPQIAVTCPWCGATTMPDMNNCCEYCGGALG